MTESGPRRSRNESERTTRRKEQKRLKGMAETICDGEVRDVTKNSGADEGVRVRCLTITACRQERRGNEWSMEGRPGMASCQEMGRVDKGDRVRIQIGIG